MDEQQNIAKQYDPGQVEDRLYKKWMDEGYFHAVPDSSKKPFYNCDSAAEHNRTAPYGPRS